MIPRTVRWQYLITVRCYTMQGDIVKILDEDGISYASYVYDSWGNILEEKGEPILRRLNPLRYRGYVYDEDTAMYYLQSRYYDPTTGKFINADDTAYIGATGTALSGNIFAYCENNCLNNYDYDGRLLKEEKDAGRAFWKNNVAYYLKLYGWEFSAKFLLHSLKDKPSSLLYSSHDKITKIIKKTNEYKGFIRSIRKKYKNKWVVNKKSKITFKSGDLFGALHHVEATVNEIWINGSRYFQTVLKDTYDFKLENYSGNWPIKIGNNMAFSDQNLGIIVTYKIFIVINTRR